MSSGAGTIGRLTNIIVVSVIIKFLMNDVFLNLKFLLLFSGDLAVCPAQNHPEVVGIVPNGETALGCAACWGAASNGPQFQGLKV